MRNYWIVSNTHFWTCVPWKYKKVHDWVLLETESEKHYNEKQYTVYCTSSRFCFYNCNAKYKYWISNFSFHTMYCETSCVLYIPEPLAREYKTHNEFHNTMYGMKIHLRFFLSHALTRNEHITTWNRLFLRIGTNYAIICLWRCCALRTSSHGAALWKWEDDSILLLLKFKSIKEIMFWYNNESEFSVWYLAYMLEFPIRKSRFLHTQIVM